MDIAGVLFELITGWIVRGGRESPRKRPGTTQTSPPEISDPDKGHQHSERTPAERGASSPSRTRKSLRPRPVTEPS